MSEQMYAAMQATGDETDKRRFTIFRVIWFGQMVSLVGSAISDFALSIWVYTSSSSVLQFALVSLAFVVPQLLIAPLAGVIVDRWNRRTIMLISDSIHALLMGAVLLILTFSTLESWHLYIITACAGVAANFQWPAYQALIPQLVPKSDLGRANGLVDLAHGLAQLAAPLGGGLLLLWIGLRGVVLLDLVTFGVAVGTLLLSSVPNVTRPAQAHTLAEPVAETAAKASGPRQIFAEFSAGWHFIRADRGLLALMVYIAVTVFLTSFIHVLTPPLVLSFATEAELGLVLTVGGVGMLAGGLLMSVWGGPQPRIYGMLVFDLLPIGVMLLVGFVTTVPWLMGLAFLFFFALPISRGSAQSIWQQKVPAHLQGRVFVTRDMLAIGATPLAFLLAGPLADFWFEPLLAVDGPLVATVGRFMGSGEGRGIGLLLFTVGIFFLLSNFLAWSSTTLRKVEQ